MMKNHPDQPVTAAVGDGANDVAMIQEAHVGLGIMGKEGRAAVRSADFAFAKFKHLHRLVIIFLYAWHYQGDQEAVKFDRTLRYLNNLRNGFKTKPNNAKENYK